MEDIKLYDEAKKSNEPSIPIDEAFKMIEAKSKVMAYQVSLKKRAIKVLEKLTNRFIPTSKKPFTALLIIQDLLATKN